MYVWRSKKFGPLFLFFSNSAHYVKNTKQHCHVFPKNLLPCRDSNPGLLSLRQNRCPLRHAAAASVAQFFEFVINP
jgi:hypothetical protein